MSTYVAREDRHNPGLWELIKVGFNTDTVIAVYGDEDRARHLADELNAADRFEVKR